MLKKEHATEDKQRPAAFPAKAFMICKKTQPTKKTQPKTIPSKIETGPYKLSLELF